MQGVVNIARASEMEHEQRFWIDQTKEGPKKVHKKTRIYSICFCTHGCCDDDDVTKRRKKKKNEEEEKVEKRRSTTYRTQNSISSTNSNLIGERFRIKH